MNKSVSTERPIERGISIIREKIKSMPKSPGVYRMIGNNDKVLYVGKAKELPKRVSSYANINKLPTRLQRMVAEIQTIEIIETKTEAEALLLEANLIKTLKPVYNIELKDDKSFPYILIEEDHDFPRVTKYRGIKKKKKGSYFGPFASAGSVNETIAELQKIFLIRPCSNSFFASRTRPCLQYQIKRCSGPCVEKIEKTDYAKSIKLAKDFLSGKSNEIQKQLIAEMEVASNNLEYEQAALLRDRIKLLTQIQAKNTFVNSNISDADIITIYQSKKGTCCIQVFFIRAGKNYGNKAYFPSNIQDLAIDEIVEKFIGQFYQHHIPPKSILTNTKLNPQPLEEALSTIAQEKVKITVPKAGAKFDMVDFAIINAKSALERHDKEKSRNVENLKRVGKLFELKETPQRIEVYDNSHIQGSHPVGCMIVAGAEGFIKNQYRKYTIRNVKIGDDYEMLREVLTRRLSKLASENYPDIMLIDGGKGHFSTAKEVMDGFGVADIKLVCIAKGVDRNAGRENFIVEGKEPFQLPKGDDTLHYLQTIRDEVHRFVIEAHRDKRLKSVRKSAIDNIPGIGGKRKKDLLNFFGSVDQIKSASIEDLAKIPGISKNIAKNIYTYLHSDNAG